MAFRKISLREKYNQLIAKIKDKQKNILIGIGILLLLFILFKPFFVFAGLIVLAVLSRLYEWFFKGLGLGIELMTFATVFCSALYGPFMGCLAGISSLTASVFINKE